MPEAPSIHVQTCPCGLQVKFKDKHIGRTLPCSNCGLDITLRKPRVSPQRVARVVVEPEPRDPDEAFSLEDPPIDLPGLDLKAASPVAASVPPVTEEQQREDAREASKARKASARKERRANGFWTDAGRAMTYMRGIDAWMKTIALVIVVTLADLAPPFFFLNLVAPIIAYGIAFTFFFNTIINSAGGDDDLPEIEWDGFWESAIKPFITVIFITLVIAAPSIALFITMPDSPSLGTAAIVVMSFLWPVIMLMVALGGGAMALRIDLAIRTIISSPLAYIAICGLLLIAMALASLALGAGDSFLPIDAVSLLETPILGSLLVNVSFIYSSLVTMKIIGLYYRHFSDRFPWDAG